MALPTFVCVGAEKGGTTPLAMVLAQHPDVFVSPQKETHYFSRLYGRGDLVFYETYFFKGYAGEKALGELTPDYMRHPQVAERLRKHLGPELKLIFCLREPLKRAFSHYLQCVRILEENDSFENAVALEARRAAESAHYGLRRAYVGGSLYSGQIERLLEHFPRENMFFMILEEDFQKNRAATVARLLDFLGVAPAPGLRLDVRDTGLGVPQIRFVTPRDAIIMERKQGKQRLPPGSIVFQTGNPGLDRALVDPSPETVEFFRAMQRRMTPELPPAFAEKLYREHFADEIGRLESLIGRDLSGWRRG